MVVKTTKEIESKNVWNDNRNCHKQETTWSLVLHNLVQNYLARLTSMSIYFRIVTLRFVLATSSALDVITSSANGWRRDNTRSGTLAFFLLTPPPPPFHSAVVKLMTIRYMFLSFWNKRLWGVYSLTGLGRTAMFVKREKTFHQEISGFSYKLLSIINV